MIFIISNEKDSNQHTFVEVTSISLDCFFFFKIFSGYNLGQAKMAEMTKCYIEGKPYQIGEHIYPDSEPCYMCHCTESFTNSTEIAKNSNCKKIDCGSELRHLDDIKVGCIPIHLESSCCATGITWKCRKFKL